jgi:hypothetical protein
MARESMTTLINYYRYLLIAIFEYYLYESYPAEQHLNLSTSCIPYSAVFDFYLDFCSGESHRLNKTTMLETLKNVLNIHPDTVFEDMPVTQKQSKTKGKRSGSPGKKTCS